MLLLKPQNIHTYDQYASPPFCLVTPHLLGHGYGFAQWRVQQVDHTNSPVQAIRPTGHWKWYWRAISLQNSSYCTVHISCNSKPLIKLVSSSLQLNITIHYYILSRASSSAYWQRWWSQHRQMTSFGPENGASRPRWCGEQDAGSGVCIWWLWTELHHFCAIWDTSLQKMTWDTYSIKLVLSWLMQSEEERS